MSFMQTLTYGREAHSSVRRIMRQSSRFEAWRQLTLHYAGDIELYTFSTSHNHAAKLGFNNQAFHETALQMVGRHQQI
eukprot:6492699-Amphidinium_carterae.3